MAFALLGAHQSWSRNRPVELSPLALAVAIPAIMSIFQLLPLPQGLLGLLSPVNAEARQTLADIASTSAGGPLTLSGVDSSAAAFRWIALALLALGTGWYTRAHRRHARKWVQYLAASLGVLGVLQVLIGLGQTLVGNGKILGVIATTRDSLSLVSGTLINGNHAAALLCLSTLSAAGMVAHGKKPLHRSLWTLASILCAAGVVLTASRGGILALCIAGLGFVLHSAIGQGKSTQALVPRVLTGLAPISLAAVLATTFALTPQWTREVQTSTSLDELHEEIKVRLIRTALSMIPDFPLSGAGADSFAQIAPVYLGDFMGAHTRFVECDPVQLLLDFGLVAGGASLLLFALTWWKIYLPTLQSAPQKSSKVPPSSSALGLTYGLLAVAISSVVSFNLEILGIAAPAVVAGQLLLALRDHPHLFRLPRWAVWPLAGVLGALLVCTGLYASSEKRKAEAFYEARPGSSDVLASLKDRLEAAPLDGHTLGHASLLLQKEDPQTSLKLAERATELFPSSPGGHLAKARAMIATGDRKEAARAYSQGLRHLRSPGPALFREILAALPEDSLRATAIPPTRRCVDGATRALIKAGRQPEVLGWLTEMQSLHPQSPYVFAASVSAAISQGEPVLAVFYADDMLERFPKEPLSYLLGTRAYRGQKNFEGSLSIATRGIQRAPEDTALRIARIRTVLQSKPGSLKQGDEALQKDLEHLRVVTLSKPEGRAEYFYLSGLRWKRLARSERAVLEFQRAHRLAPDVPHYKKAAAQR